MCCPQLPSCCRVLCASHQFIHEPHTWLSVRYFRLSSPVAAAALTAAVAAAAAAAAAERAAGAAALSSQTLGKKKCYGKRIFKTESQRLSMNELKSLCGGGVPSSHPSLGLSVFFLSMNEGEEQTSQ